MLGMQPGLVASYQYSVALVNVLISLLAFPLANLLWPRFLAQASHEGVDAMLLTAARVVAPLTLILLACCSFTERFAVEFVQLLFARGSFDSASVAQTSQALRATVFAAIPISLVTIFGRILLAQGRGRAMVVGGAGLTLSGMGVLLLAGLLGSVTLAQWHWVIGNTIGMFVMAFLLLRRSAQPEQYLRVVLAWLLRAVAIVLLALLVTPSVSAVGDKLSILGGLTMSLAVFGATVVVTAHLAGVLDLRQIFVRRQ